MTLNEAWIKLKNIEGSKTYKPSQIYSILADFGIFNEYPKLRLALKSALQNDLWSLLNKSKISISDIDNLRLKIEYDGFAMEIIEEIISSIDMSKNISNLVKSKSEVNKNDLLPKVDFPNSKEDPSLLAFMGIKLGSDLSDFEWMLKKNKFSYFNRQTSLNAECSVGYRGAFACFKSCSIRLFYNPANQKVYKIGIYDSTTDKPDKRFHLCRDLYDTKYGIPKEELVEKGKDIKVKLKLYTYRVSQIEKIELQYHTLTHASIVRYIRDDLQTEAFNNLNNMRALEKKDKEFKEAQEFKANLNQI